ncbi:MAG: phosphoribosyltransferase family protein [Candidatus Beckwithbacteria bacterium]
MSKVVDILKKVGAVITNDHFVYTSGKHGEAYINKDALYPHTVETSEVCKLMAEMYKDEEIDVVVGPALGGIILSQWVAYHLSLIKGREVLGVYTVKDEAGNQVFDRRGYDRLVKGKKVLVVEDLTTTGGSVKKTVDSVKVAGGEVIGVCVMVNRDPEKVTSEVVGAPFRAAGVIRAQAFDEKDCPFCKENRPINLEIGHGKDYLRKRGI